MRKNAKQIRTKVLGADGDTAMVYLPGHRHEPGITKKTVWLENLIPNYRGPRILLDFDKENRLISIEILVYHSDSPQ